MTDPKTIEDEALHRALTERRELMEALKALCGAVKPMASEIYEDQGGFGDSLADFLPPGYEAAKALLFRLEPTP